MTHPHRSRATAPVSMSACGWAQAPSRWARYLTPDFVVLFWDYLAESEAKIMWLAPDDEFGTVHYRGHAPRKWAFLVPVPYCQVCLEETPDNEPHSRCMP